MGDAMRGKTILTLPMGEWDDAATVGEYLRDTLKALVREGESFSGKRPLGNSDWDYQLARTLIRAKVIKGRISEDDEPEDFDWEDFNKAMFKAIDAMGTQ